MTKRNTPLYFPPKERTTYRLTGSTLRTAVHLDARSEVRLKWLSLFLAGAGALTAPPSGLCRRALAVYADHLETLQPERIRGEVQAIRQACEGLPMGLEDRQAALDRLAAVIPNEPVPRLRDILSGPSVVMSPRVAALTRELFHG